MFGLFDNAFSTLFGVGMSTNSQQEERYYNAEQAETNREFQRSEREQTQDWNVNMWERMNEYNSPTHQLGLAMSAGINPNVAIGNIGGSFARSSPTSSPMSGGIAYPAGSIANGLLLQDAQVANLLAGARKSEAEAEGKQIENSYAPSINEQLLRQGEITIQKLGVEKDMSDEQLRQAKELFPILYGKNEQELINMQKQFDILIEQYSKAKSESAIADNEAALSNFKRNIRETLQVDPDSSPASMIMQLLSSGPDGVEKAKVVFNFAVDVGKQMLREAVDNTPAGFVVETLENLFDK